jgi:cupin superfamily protein
MTLFDSLVDQWGGPTAFRAALGERRLHGRLAPAAVESLITWQGVADLLVAHRLAPPALKVVEKAGRQVNPARYLDRTSSPRRRTTPYVDIARLRDVLSTGATLVVDNVDEMLPRLGETARELSTVVGEFTQAHLYATAGDMPAFSPHWDVVDVIAVQVEGEKHWDVYGPGTPNAIDAETDPDNTRPEQPEWSGVLRQGDVLYLPRGWWHGVRGLGGTSLHISYSFQSRTGLAYLNWLGRQAQHAAPFRTDLPRVGGAEAIDQHEKVLLECLTQLAQEHPLRDYLAEHTAALATPVRPGLDGLR